MQQLRRLALLIDSFFRELRYFGTAFRCPHYVCSSFHAKIG